MKTEKEIAFIKKSILVAEPMDKKDALEYFLEKGFIDEIESYYSKSAILGGMKQDVLRLELGKEKWTNAEVRGICQKHICKLAHCPFFNKPECCQEFGTVLRHNL